MDFDIRIGLVSPPTLPDTPAKFMFYHYTDGGYEGVITLSQIKCPCGKFIFHSGDYLHMLEHEITELVCKEVFHTEGIKISAEGFNQVFRKNRAKYKKHECQYLTFRCRFG
jgi:hypothetical protein